MLRRAVVITYSALAILPACTRTSSTPLDGGDDVYQCGSATALVVCNQLSTLHAAWCGIVDPSCTLISDAGAGDAAVDASTDGGATRD